MKVTNNDLTAISNAIGTLTVKILRDKTPSVVEKAIHDRNHLYRLKKKLIHEFTISEFLEMKEPL